MAGGIPSTLLDQRDKRERLFPHVSDCGWTMLLIAWQAERPLTVSQLCGGSHFPYTTALRHLSLLGSAGLIDRRDDDRDARRSLCSLSILCREKLERYAALIAAESLAA